MGLAGSVQRQQPTLRMAVRDARLDPRTEREPVRGLSRVIDEVADRYLSERSDGGRFFIDDRHAFYKSETGDSRHLIAFFNNRVDDRLEVEVSSTNHSQTVAFADQLLNRDTLQRSAVFVDIVEHLPHAILRVAGASTTLVCRSFHHNQPCPPSQTPHLPNATMAP